MSENIIHRLTVYKLAPLIFSSVTLPGYKLAGSDTWKTTRGEYPYKLFFHKKGPQPAGWMSVFQPLKLKLEKKDIPQTIVTGFILLIQIGHSIYGVTGGIGHIHLRKNLEIEYRFGIDLAQKILSVPELRGLSQRDTNGVVNALDRVFRGIYNPQGDINNLKRVLTHMCGSLRKQNPLQLKIGKSIQASDALTVSGKKSFQDIISFLIEVENLVKQGQKKISIPQLEYIDKKAYSELIMKLEHRLVGILSQYNPDDMHNLFLDNEEIGYLPDRAVLYNLLYKNHKHEAESFGDILKYVRDLLSEVSSENDRRDAFQRMNIKVHFDDGVFELRTLFYFLCGDIEYENDVYFLNNRKWYKASVEFISIMEKELDNIECLDPDIVGLKKWEKNRYSEEKDFNASHKDLIVLDRHLVKIPDEKGGIEFCDMVSISDDRIYLIHVKKAAGAALRALFAQGFVSAKLYAESNEFRQKVYLGKLNGGNGVISKKAKKILGTLSERQRREMKVIFAIYDDTKTHSVLPGSTATSKVLNGTLSVFAKVDLLERVTNMRAMGYDVAVSRIRPYPTGRQERNGQQ